jgi:hypothetical protein
MRLARGAHRALDIVAVSDRGAEHSHDAVADVLVHPAPVLLDDVVHAAEEALQQSVHRVLVRAR